jgi:putative DNA primase/helicase
MDAAQLAHALRATRSGRQWKCKCVAHEDSSPSMIIFDGRESVQVRCLAGCDQRDLIAALKARGLWEGAAHSTPKRSIAPKVSHETEARHHRDLARRIFEEAVLTIGTPAQDYLEGREIWGVAKAVEDIRFHEACPRGPGRQPAIVVAMRDLVSRSLLAVQRIYLRRGDYRWIKDGAMMLGPVGGAAMQLGHTILCSPTKWSELHITEGLESGLAVMAMGGCPTWAMGSCGAIERFPVLGHVDRLWIWGDHDAPGLQAADRCAARWAIAGREVTMRIPNEEGYDPCDVWRDRCARQ